METKDEIQSLAGSKRSPKRDPQASRQALIDATLDTISEIGITDTTVSSIIQRAGLSRGMIHLHFGGKDNLLTSAAEYFNITYYRELDRQLAESGPGPEAVILAVVAADLSETLLNERSTKIWHAFRGVSHAHPGIAKFSSTQDKRLTQILLGAFADIAATTHPQDRAIVRQATYGTFALLEGMWVHFLSDPDSFSRTEAYDLIRRFLNGLFPGHFMAA